MIAFLKTCLKGFLTIILSPLWLAAFALAIVFGLVLFIYTLIRTIISLITRKPHGIYDTEYDKRAKEILSNPAFNPVVGVAPTYNPNPVPTQMPNYPPQQMPYYPPPPYQGQYPQNPQTPPNYYPPQYPSQYPPRGKNSEEEE